ncbi:DNA cytosine methyltransferase [Catenulispora rubra]|uniref:DNA cytosine methyltransferase n=1 Tax=Catenulispora rubra TaxID=280293 RepID=UPI0018920022|nr:DNA cytosine methyltransferase [Catenulispora rubra]
MLEIVERVDELLEVTHRSAPVRHLSGPVAELVCCILGLVDDNQAHQEVFEKLGSQYADEKELLAASETDVSAILRGAGLPRRSAGVMLSAVEGVMKLWWAGDPPQMQLVAGGAEQSRQARMKALAGLPGMDETSAQRVLAATDQHAIVDDPFSRAILRRLNLALKTESDSRALARVVPEAMRKRLRINLARHSRVVCRARDPLCHACPLISFCQTGRESLKRDERPVVVEFFGGAGGLAEGFSESGFRIAVAVELDRDAAQTHRANHPGTVVLEQNARTVTAADIRSAAPWMGEVTAVIGGPPCQGYSVAGKRNPADEKNDLFKFQVDIAAQLGAQFVVIENVPGMKQVKGVKFAEHVVDRLREKGFRTTFAPVRASDYGVPQLRHRLIFIAQSKKLPGNPPPVPLGPYCGSTYDPCRCKRQKVSTVLERLEGLPPYEPGKIAEYVPDAADYEPPKPGLPLLNASTMAHGQAVIDKIAKIDAGKGPISYRRLHPDLARTIVAGHRALPVHPILNRTISVREAARIQGFPDDYVFCGKRGTQPLQVANAVPPALAKTIADSLVARLNGEEDLPRHHGVDVCGPADRPLLGEDSRASRLAT